MKNIRLRAPFAAAALALAVLAAFPAAAKNGFDLSDALIPAAEILRGGPPRDGIPSIDAPRFVAAEDADYLADSDRILGVVFDSVARAYPIKILDWHEIVNDEIGGFRFAVTYCPLCGSGAVFDAEVGGAARRFGVSGLLFNSDVLLYDRETESLFSQIMAQAVTGPLRGEKLKLLPAQHTTWGDFRARYPQAEALSADTGFDRDYQHSPYGGYAESRTLFFPVAAPAPGQYHPKEVVLGVSVGGVHKAFPYSELEKIADDGAADIADTIGGEKVTIRWDGRSRSARAFDADGGEIAAIAGFWFAWFAFHPDTEIFRAK